MVNFYGILEYFVWKADQILRVKAHVSMALTSLDVIYDAMNSSQFDVVWIENEEIIQSESIDYGILEKAKNVFTIKTDFGWSDLGSWQSLFNVLDKNSKGSIHDGEVISIDSQHNFIYKPKSTNHTHRS